MSRALAPVCFFLAGVWLTGPAPAQDKAAALEKARARFEADVAKAEEALLGAFDKAVTKAAGNKQVVEQLKYERELFVSQRIPPTTVPAAAYLKARGASVAALEAAYLPAIKEVGKANKADGEALEAALSDLVRGARGYGLALPPLEASPLLLIENKGSGQVLEADTNSRVVLAPKVGKKRPAQLWQVTREEQGVTLRNAVTKRALNSDEKFGPDFVLRTTGVNPNKELPDEILFKLIEQRREVLIATKLDPANVVAVADRKLKGVTVYDLTVGAKDAAPTPYQLWLISEAK